MVIDPAAAKRLKARRKERRLEARRRGKRFSFPALRCAELGRIFTSRYGHELPDDDAGRGDARIMAHHLSKLTGDTAGHINDWLDLRAPWLSGADRDKLLAEVRDKPRRWKADTLADRLNLTDAERRRLGITTIGAVDVPKTARTERRKQRRQKAQEGRRRAAGAIPRAAYEAQSLSRSRPWEALNMSRATWYRVGKPNP